MDAQDSSAPLTLLNGLSPAQFLNEYWQKKPLLIKQAIPDFQPPLDADELAGLACEDDIESRIISGTGGNNDWQLRHGPFDEQLFSELGDRDWTLLVQAVDHYLPEVAALKHAFRFIPDWRLDDVMVSFAAPGGSVGPHLDQYDVFLLQGEGRRQWQLDRPVLGKPPLLPHPELQLLREFTAAETHVLETGDLLYLPPGYPHWGIAVEPCTTFSIGFRAPSHQEIISHYCDHALSTLTEQARYSDPHLQPASNPGLLDPAALAQVRQIVAGLLDEDRIADWFGRYMTTQKYDAPDTLPEQQATGLSAGAMLQVDSASRLAYSEQEGCTRLFADGESYTGQGKQWHHFVTELCARQCIDLGDTAFSQANETIETTLRELLRRGVVLAGPYE